MQRGNGAVIGKQNTPTTSVATGVWALNEVQRAVLGGNWPSAVQIDPYFEYNTLLLHGNGTNGAQNNTFLDSSTNNFTITRNGNTTQGTFTPYGSNWSNYFDGATATRLTMPSNTAFAFGTGAYTVEGWVYLPSYAAVQGTFFDAGGAAGAFDSFITNTGALGIGIYGTGTIFSSSASAVALNQWVHIAIVRTSTSSNSTVLYVNGTSVATGTDSNNWTVTTTPSIGGLNIASYSHVGYISNLRVVKGTAVYTGAFTPPTAPLTAITNTSLLTCADNRFIDDSTNNFTVTANGSPSVQRFSPFNPTAAYSAATIGGSGYFDGTGDFLTNASASGVMNFGSNDYTVEFWVYPTGSTPGGSFGYIIGPNSLSANGIAFGFGGGNTISATSSTTGYTGTATAPVNTWTHIAWVRTGTTVKTYKNGTLADTFTISNSYTDTGFRVSDNSFPFPAGYIANLRVVNGTQVYTSNFTPPAAPLTAITNTSLLLNFTNGGIIDNAMMNDLETVGNAQISTSVSKFGGGSLAFDGTGDYLVSNAATTDLYAFGTGDFTLEFWLYLNSASGVIMLFDPRNSSETNCPVVYMSSGVLYFYVNNVNVITGATLSTSTWYHIALARSGSSTRLFVNGTQSGSTYTDTNNYVCQSNRPIIGANGFVSGGGVGIYALNGYIDDLRITKGYARYTAAFTPPTLPFPDQ